ncbi:MAG: hypothetical protein QNJ15_11575 [Erythrobacter sp.]|nr:hypothetical protein [Erythrobacter sp.]
MSLQALSERFPNHPVFRPDGESMFDPKWFVIGFALSAVALIANYDLRLGMAAGILLLALGAIYLWISMWLASDTDAPRSERAAMFERFSQLARNRRKARVKELGAERGPNAG